MPFVQCQYLLLTFRHCYFGVDMFLMGAEAIVMTIRPMMLLFIDVILLREGKRTRCRRLPFTTDSVPHLFVTEHNVVYVTPIVRRRVVDSDALPARTCPLPAWAPLPITCSPFPITLPDRGWNQLRCQVYTFAFVGFELLICYNRCLVRFCITPLHDTRPEPADHLPIAWYRNYAERCYQLTWSIGHYHCFCFDR